MSQCSRDYTSQYIWFRGGQEETIKVANKALEINHHNSILDIWLRVRWDVLLVNCSFRNKVFMKLF